VATSDALDNALWNDIDRAGPPPADGQIGSLVSGELPLAHAKTSPYLFEAQERPLERIARDQASHAERK